MKTGEMFYVVNADHATINSYWYVGQNPKFELSIVAISTASVRVAEVISTNMFMTTDYEAAKVELIRVSAERHRVIVELYKPE